MGQIVIPIPVVIYTDGDESIIVEAAGVNDPMAPAQVWEPGRGYSEVKPLGVWLKFLYYLDAVIPPYPWTEPNAG